MPVIITKNHIIFCGTSGSLIDVKYKSVDKTAITKLDATILSAKLSNFKKIIAITHNKSIILDQNQPSVIVLAY